jgi:hypothetical protein
VFHVTVDEDGEVLAPPTGVQASGTADGGTEGVQASGIADGDGQGAGGDQDAAATDGVQAEGLSNGDFQFLVSILLDQLPVFFWLFAPPTVNDLLFLSCKAPPTVNVGGTEGVQAGAANGQQGVPTNGGMSLFKSVIYIVQ